MRRALIAMGCTFMVLLCAAVLVLRFTPVLDKRFLLALETADFSAGTHRHQGTGPCLRYSTPQLTPAEVDSAVTALLATSIPAARVADLPTIYATQVDAREDAAHAIDEAHERVDVLAGSFGVLSVVIKVKRERLAAQWLADRVAATVTAPPLNGDERRVFDPLFATSPAAMRSGNAELVLDALAEARTERSLDRAAADAAGELAAKHGFAGAAAKVDLVKDGWGRPVSIDRAGDSLRIFCCELDMGGARLRERQIPFRPWLKDAHQNSTRHDPRPPAQRAVSKDERDLVLENILGEDASALSDQVDDTFVLKAIEEGSSCERVGLNVGDVITAIDGEPATTDIARRERTDTQNVTLSFRRGGKPYQLKLEVK